MTSDDYDYYSVRAQQEDAAALRAACDAARERHEELADAYRLRCQLIRGLFPGAMPKPVSGYKPKRTREPIVCSRESVPLVSSVTATLPFCRV